MPEDSTALPAVHRLCEILRQEKINYCHWKSNAAIDRSASGQNDLDLLVDRSDIQRFTELLYQLGYNEAQVPPDQKLPGIRDFYGYDETTTLLVHVHAHYQLVLGHDFSKNYHLPIECAYLASAVQGELFRIPAPEYEFVVFVIRMVLKHSTLDAIIMGHGQLSFSERRELDFLLNPITREKSCNVLSKYLPFIKQELFDICVQALTPGCSLRKRIWAGQQLQSALRGCARRAQLQDVLLKFWRRVEYPVLSRLHLRTEKKSMTNGGMLIAFIGGDGSGKTTTVNALLLKLSEEFDVKKFHMGKPAWSLTTILIRGLIKIGRSLGFYPFVKEGTEQSLDTNSPAFPGYPWVIREVCTARDRYLDYRRARRIASNGGLVICDRFPLPQIRIMDGPQVERVTAGMKTNYLLKKLAGLERHYYQKILQPDLLIVLRVDPEVCVQRKTDEPSNSVRLRSQEIWNIDWRKTKAHVIEGSRSKSQVMSDVMNVVWSNL